MPKHILNNSKITLKKARKFLFFPRIGQITISEVQILTKKFNFRGHLSTFRAENIPKWRPFLRPKAMPKHFLNNSKKTLKKSRKCLSQPPKWPKHGCQLGQKCRFLGPFSLYELYFCLLGTKNFAKIVPPNG